MSNMDNNAAICENKNKNLFTWTIISSASQKYKMRGNLKVAQKALLKVAQKALLKVPQKALLKVVQKALLKPTLNEQTNLDK